jgi:predicted enzyme related to lactoylglutathione lyase
VAAASFYSRLFGWRAAKSDENQEYYLFYLDNKTIALGAETYTGYGSA